MSKRLNQGKDEYATLDNTVYAKKKGKRDSKNVPKDIATPAPGKANPSLYVSPEPYDSEGSDTETHSLDPSDDDDDTNDNDQKQQSFPNKYTQMTKSKKDDDPIEEWRQFWSKEDLYGRYLPIKELGRGSYGVVYEGISTWNSDKIGLKIDDRVAIKKVRRVFNTDTDAKRLLRELKILRTLRGHKSIVKMYDLLPPNNVQGFKTLTLVFEYVDADLSKIFKTNQYFSPLHVQYMLYHLCLGINYMHSAGIVHRDLKPANVLINADCTIKICDFGLSRGFNEDIQKRGLQRGVTSHVVTRWYRAPEVILLQQKQQSLTAIDLWSVGCIFAELLEMQKDNCRNIKKRGPLFPGDSCYPLSPAKHGKKKKIYQSQYDQIIVILEIIGSPSKEEIACLNDEHARAYLNDLSKQKGENLANLYRGTSVLGIDLLTGLLKFDVSSRFTAKQALEHPYFAKVRDIDLESVHPRTQFDFEGKSMKKEALKQLILQETLYYHPEETKRYNKAGFVKPKPKMKKKKK